jgi:hypothetical protein
MNFSIKKLSENFEGKIQFLKKQKGNELVRAGKVLNLREVVDREMELIEITSKVYSQTSYSHYDVKVLIDGNSSEINGIFIIIQPQEISIYVNIYVRYCQNIYLQEKLKTKRLQRKPKIWGRIY